jgi:acetyl esterase/lipase
MDKLKAGAIFICLAASHLVTFVVAYSLMPRQVTFETHPERLRDPFTAYVAILKEQGYNVTDRELSVSGFEELTFQELLWL